MKIAIPVVEKKMESTICMSFARAPYFLIFDTETKESIFQDNSAAVSQGGAGIKAAQLIIDKEVCALITPRCGENAAHVFNAAGIKLYKAKNESVSENINSFIDGELFLLTDIHPGFHGHGGK